MHSKKIEALGLPDPDPDIEVRVEVAQLISSLCLEFTQEEKRLAAYMFAGSTMPDEVQLTSETFSSEVLGHFRPDLGVPGSHPPPKGRETVTESLRRAKLLD